MLASAAIFCTPTGLDILRIGSRNAELSRWIGVTEWLPAYTVPAATCALWLGLFLGAILWAKCRTRFPWRDVLPVLFLTAAALYWARMVVFWALLSAPLLAQLLHRSGLGMLRTPLNAALSSRAVRRCGVAGAAALLLIAAFSPWIRPSLPGLPESRRALFDPQIPLAGLERLQQTVGAGRIYNYRQWGGLVAFAAAPRCQVVIDGRIYRHDRKAWRSYAAVSLGRDDYLDVFEKDRPAALFLNSSYHRHLIDRVRNDPDWYDLYHDATCHIFISRKNALVASRSSGQNTRPAVCPAGLETSPLP
jgi:hypothetical protein